MDSIISLLLLNSIFKTRFYFYLYICICVSDCQLCVGLHRGWKKELDDIELKFQVAVC